MSRSSTRFRSLKLSMRSEERLSASMESDLRLGGLCVRPHPRRLRPSYGVAGGCRPNIEIGKEAGLEVRSRNSSSTSDSRLESRGCVSCTRSASRGSSSTRYVGATGGSRTGRTRPFTREPSAQSSPGRGAALLRPAVCGLLLRGSRPAVQGVGDPLRPRTTRSRAYFRDDGRFPDGGASCVRAKGLRRGQRSGLDRGR